MKLLKIGLGVFLIAVLFLSVNPVHADDPSDNTSATVINVQVNGEVNASIDVSGPAELNVEAGGSSKVDVNTDNQVALNVQATDPAEVTVNKDKQGGAEPLLIYPSDNDTHIVTLPWRFITPPVTLLQ